MENLTKVMMLIICITILAGCQKDLNTSPFDAEQKKNRATAFAADFGDGESSARIGRGVNNRVFSKLVANANEKQQFAEHYSQIAIEEQRLFGIPASITLSQAILESDGGTSYNAINFKNLFGVKCKNDVTFHEVDCRLNPDLIEQGEFAVYQTPWFSFRSHSRFLAERIYYTACFKCEDYACWAEELQRANYGGDDEEYAAKLISVIEYYDLARFDGATKENTNKKPQGILSVETWILNNSHGDNTAGKRKTFKKELPNGEFTIYEYEINRQIVARLVSRCNQLGLNYKVLVPEIQDIGLMERANRANRFEKQLGKTALITIDHNATAFDNENKYSIADEYENAAKQVASGMESHIYRGSEMEAFTKRLKVNVEHFLPEWHQRGIKKSNFWTLKATSMPAAILELGFFDNYSEACFLMSDKFQSKIVEAIIMTMCEFSNIEYLGNGIQG